MAVIGHNQSWTQGIRAVLAGSTIQLANVHRFAYIFAGLFNSMGRQPLINTSSLVVASLHAPAWPCVDRIQTHSECFPFDRSRFTNYEPRAHSKCDFITGYSLFADVHHDYCRSYQIRCENLWFCSLKLISAQTKTTKTWRNVFLCAIFFALRAADYSQLIIVFKLMRVPSDFCHTNNVTRRQWRTKANKRVWNHIQQPLVSPDIECNRSLVKLSMRRMMRCLTTLSILINFAFLPPNFCAL